MTSNTKQQLAEIVTSDQYSHSKQVEIRKPKEKSDTDSSSWLEDLLDWLFDFEFNDGLLSVGAMILKGLLILALVLLVVWIVKNSEGILGWIKQKSWKKSKQRIDISDYHQSHLAQGWESLPAHQDISQVVKQLLNEDRVLPAMSILYRASLRWLNDGGLLTIIPANTELQCIQHIHQVQVTQAVNVQSADYIIDIIKQWIPVAYNHDSSPDKAQLIRLADSWQARLPIQGESV